jgi:hypothetical protein
MQAGLCHRRRACYWLVCAGFTLIPNWPTFRQPSSNSPNVVPLLSCSRFLINLDLSSVLVNHDLFFGLNFEALTSSNRSLCVVSYFCLKLPVDDTTNRSKAQSIRASDYSVDRLRSENQHATYSSRWPASPCFHRSLKLDVRADLADNVTTSWRNRTTLDFVCCTNGCPTIYPAQFVDDLEPWSRLKSYGGARTCDLHATPASKASALRYAPFSISTYALGSIARTCLLHSSSSTFPPLLPISQNQP